MKLKVLILHNTLDLSDKSLGNYHYYIGEPDTAHALNEALDKTFRYSYSLIIVEVVLDRAVATELIESIHVYEVALYQF